MPFKYVSRQKTAAPAEKPESLIGKGFRLYNTPIVDLLNQRENVEKIAKPGLTDVPDKDNILEKASKKVLGELVGVGLSKEAKKHIGEELTSYLPTTKAKLKGFVAGGTEAVTPALAAQAASLGTGKLMTAANLAIAGEGAHTLADSEKSPIERMMGGVGLIGGTAGAVSGLKIAGAAKAKKPKAPKFEVETSGGRVFKTIKGSAAETPKTAPKVTPTEPPAGKIPYGAVPVGPSKAAVAAEKAVAKLKAAEEARDVKNLKAVEEWAQNKNKLRTIERAKEGREATEPSISESLSAKTPEGGRTSMSQRFVKPQPPEGEGAGVPGDEALGDILGLPPAKPKGPKTPSAAAAKAPEEVLPGLEPEIVKLRRYKNKQEANAIAKATGGTVHQDGPRQYSVRFPEPEAPVTPEITPSPTIKFDVPAKRDMPRMNALPNEPVTEVPTGPRVIGFGGRWSVSGHPELGEFSDIGKATRALESLSTKAEDIPKDLDDAIEALAKEEAAATQATPEEAVSTMQELAAATDKPAPQIAPLKFPTAKLPGKSQAPVAEQASLLGEPAEVVQHPRTLAQQHFEEPLPPVTPESVAKAKAAAANELAQHEAAQAAFGEQQAAKQIEEEAKTARKGFKVVEPTAAPTVAEGGAIPVRLQKKSDVLGEAYAKTQAAEKAGEIPKNDPFYAKDKRGRPITPARMQGAALAESKAGKPVPPKTDVAPGPKVMTSDYLAKLTPDQQMDELTKLVNDFKAKQGKGPKGGSTVSAFGAGQLDNMIKIAAENPAFTRAMTTLAGAGIGAGTSDDPLTGALVGGAIGLGAPTALKAINAARASGLGDTESIAAKGKEVLDTFAWMLPDFQRAALLSKPLPLIMNSIVGPWGSIVMHGLEDAVRFDQRGIELLKLALNPKNFPKGYFEAIPRAHELIGEAAERTEGLLGRGGPQWYKTVTQYPGVAMTAGDEAARELAKLAGYTDEEARVMTLTSEPYTSGGAAISKFKKGATNRETGGRSWLIDMSLPFYRTNMNQLEQGMERVPFLGMWMNKYAKATPAAWQQQLAQQVIGGGVGTVGYMLGEQTPPEDAKYVLKFINNFGGQYGAIASAGFVMGQASQRGLSDWKALTRELSQSMPMPSTQPITDAMQNVGAALGVEGSEYKMPSGFVPGILDPDDPLTGLLVGAVVPKSEQAPSAAGPRPGTAPTSRFKYVPRQR